MSPGDSTVLFRALPTNLKFSTQDRQLLAEFADALSQTVAGGRSFTCLITNQTALRKLNREFLQHDYPTDVLSFPSLRLEEQSDSVELGDLAISVEQAEAQAQEFGHSRFDEVKILMLHGLLHLLGFDHENDRGRMARAERKWRQTLALPCNLIDRTRQIDCTQQAVAQ